MKTTKKAYTLYCEQHIKDALQAGLKESNLEGTEFLEIMLYVSIALKILPSSCIKELTDEGKKLIKQVIGTNIQFENPLDKLEDLRKEADKLSNVLDNINQTNEEWATLLLETQTS